MINRWVIISGQEKEFYIVDSFLDKGTTRWFGYYEGESDLDVVDFDEISSLGIKLRINL